MPTQDTQAKIARKVNFAIQLLRETAELMDAPEKPAQTQRARYPRRSIERAE
jgi:hypothetical protein